VIVVAIASLCPSVDAMDENCVAQDGQFL